MSRLRQAALRGTFWSALQQTGDRGIRLLVYLVLARLLAPDAFGLVALALAYIDFVQLFLNQGLTAAIVQRDELESEHLDSAFWGNMAFGLLLGGACLASAGLFAELVGEPEIAPIVRWLSIAFVLTGLSAVQDALLRRALNFRALAVRSFGGQAVAAVVAIALVFSGFGVWGLVALQLVSQAVGALLLWRASNWRPRFAFSPRHYRELFGFGVQLMGVQVLSFLRGRADNFLIGVFLGTTSLGYYTVARQLINAAAHLVTGSVGPVIWSTFTRLQRESERLGRAILSAAELLALVTWPVYLGIAAVAPILVPVVLGERWMPSTRRRSRGPSARWMPSVPVMQAFATVALAHSVTGSTLTAITAIGAMRWRVGLEVLVAVVTLIAIVVALPRGIVAISWAYAISVWLLLPIQLGVTVKLLPIQPRSYLARFRVPLVGSALMIGAVMVFRRLGVSMLSAPVHLAVLVALGGLIYCGFLMMVAPTVIRRVLQNLRVAVTRTRDPELAEFGVPRV